MSTTNSSGMFRGVVRDLDGVDRRVDEAAAVAATAVASPSRRSGTDTVISSSRLTWMKSTWVTVRRTGWRWSSLTIAGYTVPSTVRSSTVLTPAGPDRARRRSRRPTATTTGVHAVAVQDAGDVVGGAHAAGGGAARRAAGVGDEHGGCHGEEPLRTTDRWPERPAHDATRPARASHRPSVGAVRLPRCRHVRVPPRHQNPRRRRASSRPAPPSHSRTGRGRSRGRPGRP